MRGWLLLLLVILTVLVMISHVDGATKKKSPSTKVAKKSAAKKSTAKGKKGSAKKEAAKKGKKKSPSKKSKKSKKGKEKAGKGKTGGGKKGSGKAKGGKSKGNGTKSKGNGTKSEGNSTKNSQGCAKTVVIVVDPATIKKLPAIVSYFSADYVVTQPKGDYMNAVKKVSDAKVFTAKGSTDWLNIAIKIERATCRTKKKQKKGKGKKKKGISGLSQMLYPFAPTKGNMVLMGVHAIGISKTIKSIVSSGKCRDWCAADMGCVSVDFNGDMKTCVGHLTQSSQLSTKAKKHWTVAQYLKRGHVGTMPELKDKKKGKKGKGQPNGIKPFPFAPSKGNMILIGVHAVGISSKVKGMLTSKTCRDWCSTNKNCFGVDFNADQKTCTSHLTVYLKKHPSRGRVRSNLSTADQHWTVAQYYKAGRGGTLPTISEADTKHLSATVYLTLDSSDKTGSTGFDFTKSLVKTLLRAFPLGPGGLSLYVIAHLGSKQPVKVFKFDTKEDLPKYIRQVEQLSYKKAESNEKNLFKRLDDLSKQPSNKPCQVIGMTGGYDYPDRTSERDAFNAIRSIKNRVSDKKSMNIFYATVGEKKKTEEWAGNNIPVVSDVSRQGIVSKIWQLCGRRPPAPRVTSKGKPMIGKNLKDAANMCINAEGRREKCKLVRSAKSKDKKHGIITEKKVHGIITKKGKSKKGAAKKGEKGNKGGKGEKKDKGKTSKKGGGKKDSKAKGTKKGDKGKATKKGDKGKAGKKGDKGKAGKKDGKGETGKKGDKGKAGKKGGKGKTGKKGDKGKAGEKGDKGKAKKKGSEGSAKKKGGKKVTKGTKGKKGLKRSKRSILLRYRRAASKKDKAKKKKGKAKKDTKKSGKKKAGKEKKKTTKKGKGKKSEKGKKGGSKTKKGGKKEKKSTKGKKATGKKVKGAKTKKAGEKDKKSGGKDKKSGGKDKKAGGKDKKAGGKDKKAGGKDKKGAGKDKKAGGKDKKAAGKGSKGKDKKSDEKCAGDDKAITMNPCLKKTCSIGMICRLVAAKGCKEERCKMVPTCKKECRVPRCRQKCSEYEHDTDGCQLCACKIPLLGPIGCPGLVGDYLMIPIIKGLCPQGLKNIGKCCRKRLKIGIQRVSYSLRIRDGERACTGGFARMDGLCQAQVNVNSNNGLVAGGGFVTMRPKKGKDCLATFKLVDGLCLRKMSGTRIEIPRKTTTCRSGFRRSGAKCVIDLRVLVIPRCNGLCVKGSAPYLDHHCKVTDTTEVRSQLRKLGLRMSLKHWGAIIISDRRPAYIQPFENGKCPKGTKKKGRGTGLICKVHWRHDFRVALRKIGYRVDSRGDVVYRYKIEQKGDKIRRFQEMPCLAGTHDTRDGGWCRIVDEKRLESELRLLSIEKTIKIDEEHTKLAPCAIPKCSSTCLVYATSKETGCPTCNCKVPFTDPMSVGQRADAILITLVDGKVPKGFHKYGNLARKGLRVGKNVVTFKPLTKVCPSGFELMKKSKECKGTFYVKRFSGNLLVGGGYAKMPGNKCPPTWVKQGKNCFYKLVGPDLVYPAKGGKCSVQFSLVKGLCRRKLLKFYIPKIGAKCPQGTIYQPQKTGCSVVNLEEARKELHRRHFRLTCSSRGISVSSARDQKKTKIRGSKKSILVIPSLLKGKCPDGSTAIVHGELCKVNDLIKVNINVAKYGFEVTKNGRYKKALSAGLKGNMMNPIGSRCLKGTKTTGSRCRIIHLQTVQSQMAKVGLSYSASLRKAWVGNSAWKASKKFAVTNYAKPLKNGQCPKGSSQTEKGCKVTDSSKSKKAAISRVIKKVQKKVKGSAKLKVKDSSHDSSNDSSRDSSHDSSLDSSHGSSHNSTMKGSY
ncbi:uncharacterized protein LOC135494363 [Lineus longissimus]|uniref:uncharacterized protein LOC135494363 n=1 Tax=Lineus longissimus TaxID=88925 RepID=UPI00315C4EC4